MRLIAKAQQGRAWLTLAALALAGCAGTPKPDPTPLEAITPQMSGKQVWKQGMGSVKFPLAVAVNGGTFTVADDDGTVIALQADTGRELWRAKVGDKLSAGVGSDGRFASVVTRDNELVTLDAGKPLWRKQLASRVVTAPLVAGERVFVLGVDRTVLAFDALDGRKLWAYQRPNDALTLASPGVLTPFKDTLVVGQGPKLAGLDPLRGTLRWEATVASPRGTNEVERLADLVGPAARVGELICTRAYQAAVACVNAERGSAVWSRNAGGVNGLGADEQMVAGVDASDRISAWRTVDGTVAWTVEKLLYRNLTAPLAVGKAFVMGDIEGMVHWFARDSGAAVLRLPTDGRAIKVAPVASGLTLLVVTSDGGLFAFRPE
ncbi:MAG: outer membrane protein assembly factor BamB [Cytophagales bacterium]|nr:outer membrane protein assembly factor BamB [Rhizobacter sp.]